MKIATEGPPKEEIVSISPQQIESGVPAWETNAPVEALLAKEKGDCSVVLETASETVEGAKGVLGEKALTGETAALAALQQMIASGQPIDMERLHQIEQAYAELQQEPAAVEGKNAFDDFRDMFKGNPKIQAEITSYEHAMEEAFYNFTIKPQIVAASLGAGAIKVGEKVTKETPEVK